LKCSGPDVRLDKLTRIPAGPSPGNMVFPRWIRGKGAPAFFWAHPLDAHREGFDFKARTRNEACSRNARISSVRPETSTTRFSVLVRTSLAANSSSRSAPSTSILIKRIVERSWHMSSRGAAGADKAGVLDIRNEDATPSAPAGERKRPDGREEYTSSVARRVKKRNSPKLVRMCTTPDT